MPSFLSNRKTSLIKAARSKKNDKKRPESASSQKSETNSHSSTATVRPIQREEVIEAMPEQPIDFIDEEKAIARKLDALKLALPRSRSDTGFNSYLVSSPPPQPPTGIPHTESLGDLQALINNGSSNKTSPPTPNSYSSGTSIPSPRCDGMSRGDRSLAMSRNRREATYCKYLLRNAAHRRSASRLSQKAEQPLRSVSRDVETPSELASLTSLSSFGSMSSFQSIGSLNSHCNRDEAIMGKDTLSRYLAREHKNKITQLLVVVRRRQLAKDDLAKFSLKDVAVCGKRIDRAYLHNETLHYSGVIYPAKLVSTDDLMFPNKKISVKVRA